MNLITLYFKFIDFLVNGNGTNRENKPPNLLLIAQLTDQADSVDLNGLNKYDIQFLAVSCSDCALLKPQGSTKRWALGCMNPAS